MKVEELRIGDYVKFPIGIEKVQELSYQQGVGYLAWFAVSATLFPTKVEDLEPIPLTPEILEKNGFEKRKDGQWVIEKKRIVGCCGQTCDNTNPMVYVIWVDKGYMGVINYHPEATITKVGSYVHELQQCIRLCGIDKEIML